MHEGPNIARVAALIGDPARSSILVALMRGQALTVSELAAEAGVGLPTASSHLSQLEAGGLVEPRKQGRHKYFTLASDDAAAVIEALTGFAGGLPKPKSRPGPRDPALRTARICYNHLAGERGVQLYDSLVARGHLVVAADGMTLSPEGWDFAAGFGITPGDFAGKRPPHCRECLDWSARRSHLGGRLGRAFLSALEGRGWARRVRGTRIIAFTSEGERAFASAFPAGPRA
ncbi:Biofilm growth-associated repressor [Defluviimonas aquaemixtae]|uniref:Biofilm growth-associated repressor n=1 Tax=Albidovulum aquaemixtae TaxID=1542388 RepID=A0A2R8B7L9_9RHOB|nr:winged helix-turn-helix domain-containing protein [Defluviimonas aquaemixtae]SPH18631.1 Biofilm growth-associated repressor [Defluviimonas aquaemixtae]